MFGAGGQPPGGGGFSFGASNTPGTSAPNAGFTFGATAATTATPASGSTSGGGFTFGNTANPTGGFSGFSGFAPSSAGATSATAGAPGFSFGAAAPKATNTTANTTSMPPASGFGMAATTASAAQGTGFSFGSTAGGSGFPGLGGTLSSNNNTSVAPGTATTTTTASNLGISFGNTAQKSTAAATPVLGSLLASPATQPATLSTASTTAASTGFSLGASTAASSATTGFSFGPSLAQPSTTTTSTSLGGGLGLGGFSSTTTSTSAALTSTTSVAHSLPGGQKQMTFRQLEDTINKWTTELEEQEKCFLDQATQVNAWDRIVMENGEKIIQLNKDLERVKLDQQKLDHELDFVHSQQKELEELLTPLESALEELPPISHTQHAHLEREHTYTLAESLDSQLKRMSQDMKEIVERLNSTNVKPDDNDPLQQITKILNAHVVSLMWVDRNSTNLQRRAEEIAKMMDLEKKEQERNFRMAYS